MVDQALLQRALKLDEPARRELVALLQDSLGDGEVPPELGRLIEMRIAEADADPEGSVRLADFERQVRSRRTA